MKNVFQKFLRQKGFGFNRYLTNLTAEDDSLLVSRGSQTVIDRLTSLLPYEKELEPGLFAIMDEKHFAMESVGFTLELTPQTGATPEMANHLTGLFSADLPTGTGIQVTLFAEPNIHWATNTYEASRTPYFLVPDSQKACAQTLNHLAKERTQYLKEGVKESLSRGSHFRVRHFRAWVSVVIPLGDKALFVAVEKAKKERDRRISLLQSQFLYSHTWTSLDLYRTLRTILNAHKKESLPSRARPNPLEPLSYGLVDPDTHIRITEDGVRLEGPQSDKATVLTGLSVSGFPSDYALALTSRFIGHKALDIPCPFFSDLCGHHAKL